MCQYSQGSFPELSFSSDLISNLGGRRRGPGQSEASACLARPGLAMTLKGAWPWVVPLSYLCPEESLWYRPPGLPCLAVRSSQTWSLLPHPQHQPLLVHRPAWLPHLPLMYHGYGCAVEGRGIGPGGS